MIHDDFPDDDQLRRQQGALSALDVLRLLPNSRLAQRGRTAVLERYGVSEDDVAEFRSLWEAGRPVARE